MSWSWHRRLCQGERLLSEYRRCRSSDEIRRLIVETSKQGTERERQRYSELYHGTERLKLGFKVGGYSYVHCLNSPPLVDIRIYQNQNFSSCGYKEYLLVIYTVAS